MPTKAVLTQVQIILYNPIKRILQAPMTTPTEIITAETGIWDTETQVAEKQITYYHIIRTTKNPETQVFKTIMDPKNPWKKRVENTMRDIEIDGEELLTKKQPPAKKCITEKLKEYQTNKIYKAAETKSSERLHL